MQVTDAMKIKFVNDQKQKQQQQVQAVEVCGHRGSIYDEPENSIAGFLKAWEIGCDAVELDVFKLRCGSLVVFHGSGNDKGAGFLRDYCEGGDVNGKTRIEELTLPEVKTMKLDPSCEEYVCPDERVEEHEIPTLNEVLNELRNYNIQIKIELKGSNTAEPALHAVEQYNMVDRVIFSSFKHDYIRRVRELRPDRSRYKTGALFSAELPENFVDIAIHAGATEVHLRYNTCTNERVEAIHKQGLKSMAWFRGPRGMKSDLLLHGIKENERLYEKVMSTGVQAMCVNKPRVLVEMLNAY